MNHEYEPETDLKDLVFYVLYRWRSVLAAAFVFCVLACGYKAASDMFEAREEGSGGKTREAREYEMELARYKLAKSSYERDAEDCQKRLGQQEAYIRESVLMQVNPYRMPAASADIFVKLDGEEWADLPANASFDPTDSLLSVYTSNFHSNINWVPIEELTGKDALYLRELVSVAADYNGNTFTVQVRHSDGGTAQQVLDIIVDQILERCSGIDKEVNRHSISVTNRTLAYTIDMALADAQKGAMDMAAAYEQAILDCQAGLEELKKPAPPSGIKKYLILGFLAGAFLAAAYHGAFYILGGRVHGKYELKDRYGYRFLGAMPRPEKTTPIACVERLIHKMEGSGRQLAGEDACHAIAVGIWNLAEGYKNILVTGTADFWKLQEFTKQVVPLLDGVTVEAAEDMTLMPGTLKKLAQCDAVVLVEGRNVSRVGDVRQEHETIVALGKPVIGYVLL